MRLGDVPTTTLDTLLDRYDLLLLDAYGVFMQTAGAIPGAIDAFHRIIASGRPYQVLTNDASRLVGTSVRRYATMGFELDPDRIITSGSLLTGHFQRNGLVGSRCIVMGPADSATYVEEAGGVVVDPRDPADQLVLCDEDGFPMLPVVDAVLSNLIRQIERGRPMGMLLPNPDLIYPKGDDAFGITAGALARMFEAALHRRYPDRDDLRFIRLGKPHAAIFEEARRRTGPGEAVMIGDQLATDILGANRAGIDSVLVGSGMTPWREDLPLHGAIPTWRMASL